MLYRYTLVGTLGRNGAASGPDAGIGFAQASQLIVLASLLRKCSECALRDLRGSVTWQPFCQIIC